MDNTTYFTETNTTPDLQTVSAYRRFFDIFVHFTNTPMDDKEKLLQIFNKAWEHYKYFLPDELSPRIMLSKSPHFGSDTNNDTNI